MLHNNKKWLVITAASCLLAACGGGRGHYLYDWGNGTYANSMYQTMIQEGDPQSQLHNLETLAQNGKRPAPGLYAQIGLLYSQIGNPSQAAAAFNREAELFPESKPYMQFLLNGGKAPNDVSTPAKGKKGAKKR